MSIVELLVWNIESHVAELVRRPRTMLKMLYFGGSYQFFQISPGIKSLYDRGKKLIGRRDIIWVRGGNFSKFIDQGSHRDASHRGTKTGCSSSCQSLKRRAILKITSSVFLEEPMFFLVALKWKLQGKLFSCIKTKPTQTLL